MKYIKILVVMALAFFIADLSSKTVFLAKTPKINPNFIARLNNIFPKKNKEETIALPVMVKRREELPSAITESLNMPLKPVSKGVYAGEKNNINVYEFRQDEIDWVEYTFVINGKEMKIKVPKGQTPPKKEELEQIYK